jgi:hypothetical protein
MRHDVDVIVIRRDRSPLPAAVRAGIEAQAGPGLHVRVHRVLGLRRADDANRWETIARARNEGRSLGSAPWVFYLDDDVVLGPGCLTRLRDGLEARPAFAALAADYLGETNGGWFDPEAAPHVALGATLFRRAALAAVVFRWEPGRCECGCCCDDLRRAGLGIGYLPGAAASHRRSDGAGHAVASPARAEEPTRPPPAARGRILTAFNRRHIERFRRQFLGTLRNAGNREPVTAVTYGLYPSERNILASLPGVEVVAYPDDGERTSLQRIRDFPDVLARWPEETPVAYWDAGDVVFQASLQGVWDLVRAHPGELLVVGEPRRPVQPMAMRGWISTISDPAARGRAFALLAHRTNFNGGFAAGTARVVQAYLSEAHRLRHSPALLGTTGGDQIAMNLFCHAHPGRWRQVADGWNFCLHKRSVDEYRVRPGGRIERPDGTLIPVVHGNARTLRYFELSSTS